MQHVIDIWWCSTAVAVVTQTSCDYKWIIYLISCPICNQQYVGQSNNFRARMNGHKSDFRLYAAGKINKMDNRLLCDHLICHNIDYLHLSIVDMIHVGNNTESQLDELLSRKERKWIWDLCSITPYGLNQDDDFTDKTKYVEKVKSVIGQYNYLFSYFFLYSYCFFYFTIFSSMG